MVYMGKTFILLSLSKKHFYQFQSPCNGFPLCREPSVPLFQEHLLMLIETLAIIIF